MSLLTDADCITPQDIADEDPRMANEIAAAENINISKCISRAIDEVGARILVDSKTFSMFPSREGITPGHLAALWNVGKFNPQTRIVLQQIVVDNQDGQYYTPIRMWIMHEALLRCYRSALNNNLIDRYVDRVAFEEDEINNKYYPRWKSDGAPIVYQPLSRPAASRDFTGTGTWDSTNLSAVAGAGTGGSYDVAITYVDQSTPSTPYVSYSNVGNGESAPSDLAQITTNANQDVVVSIASLVPPNGVLPQEVYGIFYPRMATGWNIYCGPQGANQLRLQNPTPIPIATPSQQFTPIAGYAPFTRGQRREDKLISTQRFMRT